MGKRITETKGEEEKKNKVVIDDPLKFHKRNYRQDKSVVTNVSSPFDMIQHVLQHFEKQFKLFEIQRWVDGVR